MGGFRQKRRLYFIFFQKNSSKQKEREWIDKKKKYKNGGLPEDREGRAVCQHDDAVSVCVVCSDYDIDDAAPVSITFSDYDIHANEKKSALQIIILSGVFLLTQRPT